MTYVKWTGNSIPGDGTSRVLLEDGSEVVRGVPVDLSADDRKSLEEKFGFVFESSSAEEAKAVAAATEQTPGGDVMGTGPNFVTVPGETNQADDAGEESDDSGEKS